MTTPQFSQLHATGMSVPVEDANSGDGASHVACAISATQRNCKTCARSRQLTNLHAIEHLFSTIKAQDPDLFCAHIIESEADMAKHEQKIFELLKEDGVTDFPQLRYCLPKHGTVLIPRLMTGVRYYVEFNGTRFVVQRFDIDDITDREDLIVGMLAIKGPSQELVETMIKETFTPSTLGIYQGASYRWKKVGNLGDRNMDTLIFPSAQKAEMIKAIEEFTEPGAEAEYGIYGIRYKLCIVLCGPPGTGKTSFGAAIATHMKRSLYMIPFDGSCKESDITELLSSIKGDGILVFEDFDCMYDGRKQKGSSISFSSLINILDGARTPPGLIIVITTNHMDKIDPALLRPGRVDYFWRIRTLVQEQIDEFFKLYKVECQKQIFDEFSRIVIENEMSPAALTWFMFMNRRAPYDESIFPKLETYIKQIGVERIEKEHAEKVNTAPADETVCDSER